MPMTISFNLISCINLISSWHALDLMLEAAMLCTYIFATDKSRLMEFKKKYVLLIFQKIP